MPETQGYSAVPGILAEIVASKRAELGELLGRARSIEAAVEVAPTARDFAGALSMRTTVALIAECKRRSPGAGAIRPGLDPAELTRGYERAGAAALSVLTDENYFGGSLADLGAVRLATTLPILRKDFTLDTLHVLEARGAGADAILLIVRILTDHQLGELHRQAMGLGMSVLVETHDAAELDRALRLGARLIGVNNRDLATFTTDLETTVRLLDSVPGDVVVISESGIRTPDDVRRLGDVGVDAVLVGETLLRAEDPTVVASSLAGLPRVTRSG